MEGEKIEEYLNSSKRGKRWTPWIRQFMKAREFEVSWHNKDRGKGATNTGVPQGSPLLPVLFLIWMVPILSEMKNRV